MFINKANDGKNNVCRKAVYAKRMEMKISQKKLADLLQLSGLDVDKNAIQKLEAGERFVTDIELKHLSKVLNLSYEELLGE